MEKQTIKWQGNKDHGIEFRSREGEPDEVLIWRNGDCLMHLERMDDNQLWIGLHFDDRKTIHLDLTSKSDITISKR